MDARYVSALMSKFASSASRNRLTCYDVLMTILPGLFLTLAVPGINLYMLFAMGAYTCSGLHLVALRYLEYAVIDSMASMGALTVFSEWKRIPRTASKALTGSSALCGVFFCLLSTFQWYNS